MKLLVGDGSNCHMYEPKMWSHMLNTSVCVCVKRSLDISLYGFILWLVSLLSLEEQSLDKMQAARI